MSHYLHHIIEIKKDDKWQTFSVFAKPSSYIHEQYPERIMKIGDEEFYKNSEFVSSYLMLRDNYFSHNPWKRSEIFGYGVPKDADEKTVEITKEYVDGHFSIYNCTASDLMKEADNVYKEMRDLQKKEDIMTYNIEFLRRLGFKGNEDPDMDYAADNEERIEDLSITYNQLLELNTQVTTLVESVYDDCWFNQDNIRIVIWTD